MLVNIFLMLTLMLSITGCFGKKSAKFSVNQCIMAVDDSKVWKIVEVQDKKIKADLLSNSFVPVKGESLNLDRHYVSVDCPKVD